MHNHGRGDFPYPQPVFIIHHITKIFIQLTALFPQDSAPERGGLADGVRDEKQPVAVTGKQRIFIPRYPPPDFPVLLVDDVVYSGWTLTICGARLRNAGSGPVLPFTLATASSGDAP